MAIQTSQITTAANGDLTIDPNGTGKIVLTKLAGGGELPLGAADADGNVHGFDHSQLTELPGGATDGDLIMVQRGGEYYSVDASTLGGIPLLDPDPRPSSEITFDKPVTGTGTKSDPFVLSEVICSVPGGTVQSNETCTITTTERCPALLPMYDQSEGDAKGRFEQGWKLVDASQTSSFKFDYFDNPDTPLGSGQNYDGIIKLGSGSVYVKFPVVQIANKTVFGPGEAPNASPLSVDYSADDKYGKGTATWADGSHTISSTDDLIFGVNGGTLDASAKSVNDGDAVEIGYVEATVDGAAEGDTISGTLVSADNAYYSAHGMVKDITPLPFAITPLSDQELNGVATTGNLPLKGVNAPTAITLTSSTLTNVELSVNGAAFSSGPWTFNPGDSLQARGTTGGAANTTYNAVFNINGDDYAWEVTTVDGTPTIEQPTIVSPASGSGDIVPDVTLVGDAYSPLDGAGAHAESDWEVYEIGCVPYEVDMYGLRFDGDRSTTLNKSFSQDSATYTFSCWFKRLETLSDGFMLLSSIWNDLAQGNRLVVNSTGNVVVGYGTGSDTGVGVESVKKVPVNTWSHIVISINDSTKEAKISINGNTETFTIPQSFVFETKASWFINRYRQNKPEIRGGYLSDVYFVDGQELGADTFGSELADGSWVPLAPAAIDANIGTAGGYGTNGFHLPFDPAATGANYTPYLVAKSGTIQTPEEAFNGLLGTNPKTVAEGDTSAVFEFTIPPELSPVNGEIVVYAAADPTNSCTVTLSDGTTQTFTTGGYAPVTFSGVSGITSFTVQRNGTANTAVAGIEINGFLLTNHNNIGVDASGRDNHFHDKNFAVGNTDELWSTGIVAVNDGTGASGNFYGPPVSAFNGDLSFEAASTGNGVANPTQAKVIRWDCASFGLPTVTSLRVYVYADATAQTIELNGNGVTVNGPTLGVEGDGISAVDCTSLLSAISGNLTSITVTNPTANTLGTSTATLAGVEINGVLLIDANIQDTVLDTPVTDYAVLSNPGHNGNLVDQGSSGNLSTIPWVPGKSFYVEWKINSTEPYAHCGLDDVSVSPRQFFTWRNDFGENSYVAGDIIAVSVDGSGNYQFYKNGAAVVGNVGNTNTFPAAGVFTNTELYVNTHADGPNSVQVVNFGQHQGEFAASNVTSNGDGTVTIDGTVYNGLYESSCGATSNNPPSADGQGTPDPAVYALVDSSMADTVNLESYTPGSPPLTAPATYYSRVKYRDNGASGGTVESLWSNWNEITTGSPPEIGEEISGGYFAGQIYGSGSTSGGIDDAGVLYNIIVAPKFVGDLEGEKGSLTGTDTSQYKTSNTDPEDPTEATESRNKDFGGLTSSNFAARTNYPVFRWLVDAKGPNAGAFDITGSSNGTGINGFNDWYVPSLHEMYVVYYNMKPGTRNNSPNGETYFDNSVPPYPEAGWTPYDPSQTDLPLFKEGGDQAFNPGSGVAYWMSTLPASRSKAFGLEFKNGTKVEIEKTELRKVRVIRRERA